MQKIWKRLASLGLTLALCLGLASQAFAAGAGSGTETAGGYSYTSNERNNIQQKDSFLWREDCFRRSSFLGCDHLRLLSAQAALASTSRYGAKKDAFERDCSDSGENIRAMLKGLGFSDVETNAYYQTEPLDNSAAVAVGRRTVRVDGRAYTLLAVIPRSAGYKQEWAGDLTVGGGMMHEGFKAGRDEVLRFLKRYLAAHEVTGSLKVWIAGHSRGAAISNLLGGFLAGGGIDYFGTNVSITPEDIYCYAFSTPGTIVAGLSRAEERSVAGDRDGAYAGLDTPQAAYVCSDGGAVDLTADVYRGIRSFCPAYDLITGLPTAEWGYTRYGSVSPVNRTADGAAIGADSMAKQLSALNTFVYEQWRKGGDYRDFRVMDFDLASLSPVPLEGGASGEAAMTAFVNARFAALAGSISRDDYVSGGTQDTLAALGGVFGLVVVQYADQLKPGLKSLAKPLLLSYLAYASQCLRDEGRAQNETEAVTVALVELLDHFTGAKHDPATITVDEFVLHAATELYDNTLTSLTQKLVERIPADHAGLVKSLLGGCVPGYDDAHPENTSLSEVVMYALRAISRGPAPGSAFAGDKARDSAAEFRALFYPVASLLVPDAREALSDGGTHPFSELVGSILPLLLKVKDTQGDTVVCATAAEAADVSLAAGLQTAIGNLASFIEFFRIHDPSFVRDLRRHEETLLRPEHVTLLRTTLMNLLFRRDGAFDTAENVRSLATFLGNARMIPCAHYCETAVAWGKAAVAAQSGHGDTAPSGGGYVPVMPAADDGASVAVASPVDSGKRFPDVSDDAWYAEAVRFVTARGLFQGTDKGFEPDIPMSRAMLATVLYRLERATATGVNPFADVPDGIWYTDAVIWAGGAGIVTGTGRGFEPDAPVTREQIAVMFWRYANYLRVDTGFAAPLDTFNDGGETSAWARTAMEWAVSVGLFRGDAAGALDPQGEATRAMVAVLMQRMAGLVGK